MALAGAGSTPAMIEVGWGALGRRRDRTPTVAELAVMLARARLVPIAWRRIYDLGPLPLVRAVVAACS